MRKFKPGISFGDFVVKDLMVRKTRGMEDKPIRDFRRGFLIWVVVLLAFGLLFSKLFSLQIISGERYRVLADENRIRKIKLPAPRGKILDQDGRILAGNIEQKTNTDGVTVQAWKRNYPETKFAAHTVGTVGEVAEEEVGLLKREGGAYEVGEMIGRTGLEAEYESRLRGKNGGMLVEVDSRGEIVRNLGMVQPEAGQDVFTSLDVTLQRTATLALSGLKGAVVVSVPRTGEVLALVSSPGFDPNNLSSEYLVLSTREDKPLFNRAIGGVYPPGSTYKMITSLAAMESGKVSRNFTFRDEGIITIGDFRYTNWLFTKRGAVEGVVNFSRAITRSTDTFFYRVGESTGPEEMGKWSDLLGLGKLSGIDIPGEVLGLVPSREWKMKTKGEQWYTGNSFLMAIGQDDVLASPLQINLMTNVLATNGIKCRPHLINITPLRPPLNLRGGFEGELCEDVKISQESLEIIKKGMIGACSSGGTAYVFFGWNEDPTSPTVACKTGTAEYVAENGKMKTHGWLTAYAPADEPRISVTALVEGGGEGSDVAAPIVRKIMASYFDITDNYPYDKIPKGSGE